MEEDIQVQVLRDFEYNPLTGILTRKTGRDGPTNGTLHDNGYLRLRWKDKLYYVSHIIWVYCYGDWPKQTIDHINGIKTDNRLDNLRDVSLAENIRNRAVSRSPERNIHLTKDRKIPKYHVQFTKNKKTIHVGSFDTKEEAYRARDLAEKQLEAGLPGVK